jgi:UDP-N-acetyl-D-mannosaminuronic acid dehydrogenase
MVMVKHQLELRGSFQVENKFVADVCCLGLGYIGLPTSAVIAQSGARVLGVDINPDVVEAINAGRIHIEEADLDALVAHVVADKMLRASLDMAPAKVFLIAVPTPFKDGHVPDISYVLSATSKIAPVLKSGDLVILESTSPVGTTEAIRDLLSELRPDLRMPSGESNTSDVSIAYCPERVLPGRILIELIQNDRSIGGITPRCADKAAAFYKQFVKGDCITTTARIAEMVKLSENACRDVNIAFANELSLIADKLDLDIWEIIRLANRHPRVNILTPGPGVGGHCIAVDPWFIVHSAPDQSPLIRTARQVNDGKTRYVIDHIVKLMKSKPEERVAVLGLAFKANIDDLRESPALRVAEALWAQFGDRVVFVEPYVRELPPTLAGAALKNLDTALSECGIIVALVDHNAFKAIGSDRLIGKTIYDTRGVLPK